jgi:hypothetical protein
MEGGRKTCPYGCGDVQGAVPELPFPQPQKKFFDFFCITENNFEKLVLSLSCFEFFALR